MSESTQKTLLQINRHLKKMTSLRYAFLRGMMSGLGSALGATLVLAVALGLLVRILQTMERLPLIGGVVGQWDLPVDTPTSISK